MANPDLGKLAGLIAEVGVILSGKRAELAAMRLERAEVAALPLTRADLTSDLCAWVDDHTALYRDHLKTYIAPYGKHPDRELPAARQPRDVGLVAERDGTGITRVALLALLGEPIKARLAELMNELDLPDHHALPRAERRQKLADLDTQIAALADEIAALEKQIGAAGVVVQRRKPTAAEIKDAFSGGEPTDPAARQRAIENLERRLNGEERLPPERLPPWEVAPSATSPATTTPMRPGGSIEI